MVSAVIDTVKCAKDVSFLSLGSSGDNLTEPNGLDVKFGIKSMRFLSSIFENVSVVVPCVSQNDDDRAGGVSVINDDVGEVAGREEDEMAFGDSKDPDAEDIVPPDDRLLDVAVAGILLWNVSDDDDDKKFPSNGGLVDIVWRNEEVIP